MVIKMTGKVPVLIGEVKKTVSGMVPRMQLGGMSVRGRARPALLFAALLTGGVAAAAELPAGELGASVERGRLYVTETRARLPEFAGTGLNCKNCHLNAGTVRNAAAWSGVAATYPQYRSRAGRVISLEERINSCFVRSLNGKALPLDHPAMIDMVAYMGWLSEGVPVGSRVDGLGVPQLKLARAPDREKGSQIYAAKCAACHGPQGAGLKGSDGQYVFPPLWGNDSFNVGAGMARLYTAAGFVKHNMPLGSGGTLSDDDAYDVAGFFMQQPRPDFADKARDWPNGDKPEDVRY